MNGFEIKIMIEATQLDDDTIRLTKRLDLSGYALKNFQPKISIENDNTWIIYSKDANFEVKFGNSF